MARSKSDLTAEERLFIESHEERVAQLKALQERVKRDEKQYGALLLKSYRSIKS